MNPLTVTLILWWGGVQGVSVDPDMEDLPMQAETEDVFVFPSMKMNPLSLDVQVNYRGMPPKQTKTITVPKETERGGGAVTPITRRSGVLQGYTLKPGAGSWMFNSIETKAKKGLPPTHVPKLFSDAPSDLIPESSRTVYSTPAPRTMKSDPQKSVQDRTGSHSYEKPTIPSFYKEILKNSNDYQHWQQLKNNFLREQKMLFAKSNLGAEKNFNQPGNFPKHSGSSGQVMSDNDNDDKFPHFPDKVHTALESNGVGKDVRPQREIKVNLHSAPPVYKEGGTLYRKPTGKQNSVHLKNPAERKAINPPRPPAPVRVSSLRTTPHPGSTYSSPLYPNSIRSRNQIYTTPQPPLPPGYELVPVDQLTDDHEVVPWEDLPHLMKKHNLSLNHIPLGPFQHSTPTPYPNYSPSYPSHLTPSKHPSYSPRPTPYPKYSPKPNRNYSPTPTPKHIYSTTKKPFTAFSPHPTTLGSYSPTPKYGNSHVKYYPTQVEKHNISPFIPPPVSPDIGLSLFSNQEDQHSPKHQSPISNNKYKRPNYANKSQSKPKSIHFGTNFPNIPKNVPKKISATYRYNPTTAPTQENNAHTPSLISYTSKSPTRQTLGRFSPTPQFYSTTAAPFFESTKIPKQTHYPRPTHNQLSSTASYASSYPTVRYSHSPTKAPTHSYYSSTTVRNNYRTPTTATYLNMRYNVQKSTPAPKKQNFPPPMPKFLPPPNNPLPTYFDVSTPVNPIPPVVRFSTPRPITRKSPRTFRPKIQNSITPVPIFHMPSNNPQTFVGPKRPSPNSNSFIEHSPIAFSSPPPLILQGRLNTQGNSLDSPHVVFPSNVIRPLTNPQVKFGPTPSPALLNHPTDHAIFRTPLTTKVVAVFRPNAAVPEVQSSSPAGPHAFLGKNQDREKFEHFTKKTGSASPSNQILNNFQNNGHLRSNQQKLGKETLDTGPKPDKRLIALTTMRPDMATKLNPNKMRSSTHKNNEKKKIARLNVRPHKPQKTSPNFHPIQLRPNGRDTLVPQARPNVPVSESDHTGGMRQKIPLSQTNNNDNTESVPTDRSVLTSNNNGIWFIEEKMKDFVEDKPLKREFSPGNNRTTINPAITERPRTWPSALKTSAPKQNAIYDDVTVIERSKNGQTEQKFTGKTVESTTFSTSRVQVSVSTTPSPSAKGLMKLMKHKKLNNIENQSDSALKELMQGKGKKLLDALKKSTEMNDNDVIVNNRGKSPNAIDLEPSSSERNHGGVTQEFSKKEAMENKKLGRLRRKKFRQRAKALATALEDMQENEPYIVFPMDNRNTKNKNVAEIFDPKNHPGLKRISAYDFEAMERARKAEEETNLSISQPVAELKVSIEDLANTMSKLSKSVIETTTKKDSESDVKISQLQEEIAKLTRTLENLKLAPSVLAINDQEDSQVSQNIMDNNQPKGNQILRPRSSHNGMRHVEEKSDPFEPNTRQRDSQEAGSINIQNTWLSKGNWETVNNDKKNNHEFSKKPEKLEIIEVYTLPTTQKESILKKTWRTTFRPEPETDSSRLRFSTTPRPRQPENKWFIKPSMSSNNVFQNNKALLQEEIHETTTRKHATNNNDISKFFGSTNENDFIQINGPTLTAHQETNSFFKPQNIKPQPNDAQSVNHANMRDINHNEPHGGVLGLFEMMGKINKEATDNFNVIQLPTKADNVNQQLRFEEIQAKMRMEQIDKLKAEEEELRSQQREKLKLFQRIQEEEEAKKQEELLLKKKHSKLNSFDSLQGWTDEKSWEQTITQNRKTEQSSSREKDDPGVAYASITIENVDVNDARDYEVNNGIVKLKKGETNLKDNANIEYEYEYYEADVDDIKFPVGGTQQFYESQTEKANQNVNQLTNKELLMNLLQASNNFQNHEFLDRLKSIVIGSDDNMLESLSVEDKNYIQNNLVKQNNGFSQGSVTLLENNLNGVGEESNTRSVLRSFDGDSWAPTSNHLVPSKPTKLKNNVNNLPIWPSSNSFNPPKDQTFQSSNDFEPVGNPIRFPNRRMDDGFGVGEISLVTGNDRKKVTSLSGFQTSPVSSQNAYTSNSRISDKLDTTSDTEFVVGTSLSMNQGSRKIFGRNTYDSTERSNANIGYATPVSTIVKDNGGYRTGTATPVKNNGYGSGSQQSTRTSGSEVFRLGNGIQIQQPGNMGQTAATNNQNYILPTYSNNPYQYGIPNNGNLGEIYTDIRIESGKKNLLTLPTDPNSLYIKSTQDTPEAEVIVYPMGQLLTNTNHKQITSNDQMIMSGSADTEMTQDLPARTRDQVPVYHLSRDVAETLDADTELYDPRQEVKTVIKTESRPKGILQTLIRSAKDDLHFAGNVINFLTRS